MAKYISTQLEHLCGTTPRREGDETNTKMYVSGDAPQLVSIIHVVSGGSASFFFNIRHLKVIFKSKY